MDNSANQQLMMKYVSLLILPELGGLEEHGELTIINYICDSNYHFNSAFTLKFFEELQPRMKISNIAIIS
jgi:hypothetical protein